MTRWGQPLVGNERQLCTQRNLCDQEKKNDWCGGMMTRSLRHGGVPAVGFVKEPTPGREATGETRRKQTVPGSRIVCLKVR